MHTHMRRAIRMHANYYKVLVTLQRRCVSAAPRSSTSCSSCPVRQRQCSSVVGWEGGKKRPRHKAQVCRSTRIKPFTSFPVEELGTASPAAQSRERGVLWRRRPGDTHSCAALCPQCVPPPSSSHAGYSRHSPQELILRQNWRSCAHLFHSRRHSLSCT